MLQSGQAALTISRSGPVSPAQFESVAGRLEPPVWLTMARQGAPPVLGSPLHAVIGPRPNCGGDTGRSLRALLSPYASTTATIAPPLADPEGRLYAEAIWLPPRPLG